jgi:hypothetical protein
VSSPLPLPRPPELVKPVSPNEDKAKGVGKTLPVEDKMQALIAYRMTRGLCNKCGEKWGKGHQCATTVQLNVLQELWELFELDSDDQQEESTSELLMLFLSKVALTGVDSPRTLKIQVSIQNVQILVLLDSGSSHSFLGEQVAVSLQGVSQAASVSQVKVANGSIM